MKQINEKLEQLLAQQESHQFLYSPTFLRLTTQQAKEELHNLLSIHGLSVNDFIKDQLKELIKINNPTRKFTDAELEEKAAAHIYPLTYLEYGVWVYYPWSNKLVHLVDEEEFIQIRTSRNEYKITRQERDVLRTKKIGIVGLSVGQAVAVTLAMERVCGELRLADFDTLELTNLNRIRTGTHNLGLPKVVAVAREIAEIDPFLTITCYPEGLLESNMDDFFTKNGKLDLLVEESDGFDIKITSRYKARELQVPVLMETSDRCTVDVERFDLEPNRSILHGSVDHLDIATLKTLKTNEQKIPYVLAILGIETSSTRLKASMVEIEQTITSWPQLGSSVTMGGGITADVSRRILLNQFTESGRYYIDVEELISNKKTGPLPAEIIREEKVSASDFADKARTTADTRQLPVPEDTITQLVAAACTAPSGGNAQPWRWVFKEQTLFLFNGTDSSDTLLGYGNLGAYVGLGAAAENILLKAAQLNLKAVCTPFPDQQQKDLVAIFRFYTAEEGTGTENIVLAAGIEDRLTNRNISKRAPINTTALEKIRAAAEKIPGATVNFFTADEKMDKIGEILGEIEKIRLLEKTGHRDFIDEIRWTEKENLEKRDGIDIRTLDVTASEMAGLQVAKDYRVIELVDQWNGGNAFKKLTTKTIGAAGAVGVITMPDTTDSSYFEGGRALQRAWIAANLEGISFHLVAAPFYMFARLILGKGEGLSKKGKERLENLRGDFCSVFELTPGRGEIFIFKLAIAGDPEVRSLRKPLEETFHIIRK